MYLKCFKQRTNSYLSEKLHTSWVSNLSTVCLRCSEPAADKIEVANRGRFRRSRYKCPYTCPHVPRYPFSLNTIKAFPLLEECLFTHPLRLWLARFSWRFLTFFARRCRSQSISWGHMMQKKRRGGRMATLTFVAIEFDTIAFLCVLLSYFAVLYNAVEQFAKMSCNFTTPWAVPSPANEPTFFLLQY